MHATNKTFAEYTKADVHARWSTATRATFTGPYALVADESTSKPDGLDWVSGSTDDHAMVRALRLGCPFASRASLPLHVVSGFIARASGSTPVRARSSYASAMAELRDGRSKAAHSF